jgi:hypothetical protein
MRLYSVQLFVFLTAISLVGCDKKDACLDSGGCWDKVDSVCRKHESNAQELCSRNSKNFSAHPYLDDFEALKVHISKSYANLMPLLEHNKIDPYRINETTIQAIKSASNESEAKEVLVAFAKKFKDGHFRIREPKKDDKNNNQAVAAISKALNGKQACEEMEFSEEKRFDFKFPIEGVKVLKQSGGEFPYLVVDEPKKIGIIRVADFRPSVYPELCIRAWEQYKGQVESICDEDCQDDFKYVFLRKKIVDKFYESLEEVRKSGISGLVIDLTHNGGGSDWVEDVTALLTDRKLVCGRSGFVKHPHHAKNFKELLADLETNSPNDKAKIANMKTNINVASESCDRTPIWTKKGYQLNCSLIGYPKEEKCKYDGELRYPGKKKYSGKRRCCI